MARQIARLLAVALTLALFSSAALAASTLPKPKPQLPVKGMVTLVDLGTNSCIPCKMMAPILVELEKEYRGKAAVVFVDLRQDNEAARKFRVRAIPTQIFFDKAGREVFRHEGFMDKKSIVERLNKLFGQ
ncbi:thioredoxin family protein [Humidesulfovibrio sp.]